MTKQEKFHLKDWAIVTGVTLGLLALIPLFAVLGLAFQFAFVVVMPALLIGSAVYALTTRAEVIITQVQGIDVPSDLRLHSGHSWARRVAPNCVVTGVDDFAQRLIGPLDSIETAAVGTRVEEGDVLATLQRGERGICIRAPMAGRISAANPLLGFDPALVNRFPYGRGWLAEITTEASSARSGLKKLLGGGRATRWMRREVDRLVSLTAPATAACTLADGGELQSDVSSSLDEETWQRMVAAFFP
jgi:glycine cleavage system H protein